MSDMLNSVSLAQRLVRSDTIMGGHGERTVLEYLAGLLKDAGFAVRLDDYDAGNPDCCSLSAHLHPEKEGAALCLAGHVDTVPLGGIPWKYGPLSGEIVDGKLYGRGSCDMKSGVAAMVCAALRMAPFVTERDLVVQVYGGEERGCLGSFHMTADSREMAHIAAVVVGEPTNALPLVGHKGALWLTLTAHGKTAHASMPEKGENALASMLPAASRLLRFKPHGRHRYLGSGTSVLSTLHAGLNSNSVPDLATMTLDIRSVPGMDHEELRREVKGLAGEHISMETTLDIPPVWTEPDHPWIQRIFELYHTSTGKPASVSTVQFFTDAAALKRVCPDVPMLILGPGSSAQAHQVDEACELSQIYFVEQMYCQIIRDWYGSTLAGCNI